MAEDKVDLPHREAPWRDPDKWAAFCEMHRDLMLVATDVMEGIRDGRYKATVLTRFSPDELSPAMHHLANLLEADARFLRIAAGIKRDSSGLA